MKRLMIGLSAAAVMMSACGDIDQPQRGDGWRVGGGKDPDIVEPLQCEGELQRDWHTSELSYPWYDPTQFGFSPQGDRLRFAGRFVSGAHIFSAQDGARIDANLGDGSETLDPSWTRAVSMPRFSPRALVRDVERDEVIGSIDTGGETAYIVDVDFMPDDERIVALDCRGGGFNLMTWSPENGVESNIWEDDEEMHCLGGHGSMEKLRLGPEGRVAFISMPGSGHLARVDLSTGETVKVRAHALADSTHIGPYMAYDEVGVVDLAVDPRGELVATSGIDDTVRLWDANTLEPVGEPIAAAAVGINVMTYAPGRVVSPLAWSPDGSVLAMAGPDGQVVLRDRRGEEVGSISIPPVADEFAPTDDPRISDPVGGIAFSPDGSRIALGNYLSVGVWSCN